MRKVHYALLILMVFASIHCNSPGEKAPELDDVNRLIDITVEEFVDTVNTWKVDNFGFRVGSLEVSEHAVQRNESFYVILSRLDFSPQEIHSITNRAAPTLDNYHLKPGQSYHLYASGDSENEERDYIRMVWQPNSLDYVVLDWQDSLRVFEGRKEMEVRETTVAGKINGSLYEALVAQKKSPLLAYKLSEVFAWEIDFFRLRSGDEFKVVFEEKYIDGEFITAGDILAAEFTHRGEKHKAFKYENGDEGVGYYDEEGNSVQKALLKAPFKYSQRISSHFSNSRFHPILKRNMPHHGVDYAAPPGTPVLSVGDGEVTEARYRGANGNIVKVRHNGTYRTAYLHLQGFANGIYPGARVEQGQVIGYVGSTGRSTGPHLDYRVYKNGSAMNPLTLDLPSSDAIPEAKMDEYRNHIEEAEKRIERLTAGEDDRNRQEERKISSAEWIQ